jgi:heme o synthase
MLAMTAPLYGIAAIVLGGLFLRHAWALYRRRPGSEIATFRYSIIYLGLLFLALLIDHYTFGRV